MRRRALVLATIVLVLTTGCGGSTVSPPEADDTGASAPTPGHTTGPTTGPSTGPGTGPVSPATTRFRVASFNALGASHTDVATGTASHRAPGVVRARWTARVLANNGIDLVGLQEVEPPQFLSFRAHTRGTWGVYPGLERGARALANSVAWRKDAWTFVRGELFAFPYFSGRSRTAPVVVLRNRASGRQVAVINVHNPATTPHWGDNRRWRAAALRVEGQQVARWTSAGYPVIVTGDFNEVRPAFCSLTRTGLRAASGGVSTGSCVPSRISGVDWIFGSADVQFRNYVRKQTPLIKRTSDHPIVVATAEIGGD